MAVQTRPEPMNSSPHHPKVKVLTTLPNKGIFVAGTHVSGKMEMECRADKGLGIGEMMVELFASQELTSRDHSATSTFLQSRRLFQGPGLPPSNAVQAYPQPGDPPLPQNYYQARRGISTFLFRIPLPSSSPSSIRFGGGLARVRYELRATVSVIWKGEKRLVANTRELDVVECWEEDFSRVEPEGIVVGEYGKIWAQAMVVGGMVVAGEPGCLELQVKNHSSKKNTGLTLTLGRKLVLPDFKSSEKASLQISDVLITVPFRGPQYVIHPGAEGVASLVFDVPKDARGAKGGTLAAGDEAEGRATQSIFEVQCILGITINMGIGTKDIHLDLPVSIIHPAALPEPELYVPTPYPGVPYLGPSAPYLPAHNYPVSPPLPAMYFDEAQNQIWLPPPVSHTPQPIQQNHHHYVPHLLTQDPEYDLSFPPSIPIAAHLPPRSLSVGPVRNEYGHDLYAGMGMGPLPMLHDRHLLSVPLSNINIDVEPEEGKGARAERVAQHLRLSSRHRSVSPRSHRFPLSQPKPPAEHGGTLPLPPLIHARSFAHMSLDHGLSSDQDIREPVVHSPRPFLSPKLSSPSTSRSLPKSERVEELERMAEEVGNTTKDLSSDLPELDSSPPALSRSVPHIQDFFQLQQDGKDNNINKTLPATPLATVKEREQVRLEDIQKELGRVHANDRFFTLHLPEPEPEPETPLPLCGANTPVTLPSKSKSLSDFRMQLQRHFRAPADAPSVPSLNGHSSGDGGPFEVDKAPPTPRAAITPVKVPVNTKSSELRAYLQHPKSSHTPGGTNPSGQVQVQTSGVEESGLDALERRLLAEVGTRKVVASDVRNVAMGMGVQPIDIPGRGEEPLNDSAISSLALAEHGLEMEMGMGLASGLGVPRQEYEHEYNGDGEHDHDSDERTHRGGRSTVSGGSRKVSGRQGGRERERGKKGDNERERRMKNKNKEREKYVEGEGRNYKSKKKANAAKGRVAAWLGNIEPEVPPMDEEVLPSTSVVGKMPPFLDDVLVPSALAVDEHKEQGEPEDEVQAKPEAQESISSAPNPRSSGFVPLGTVKHDTPRHRRFYPPTKDSTVVAEARKVTDLLSSSSPPLATVKKVKPSFAMKDVSPILPLISPSTQVSQSIRTDRRFSPPSSGAALDVMGAKYYSHSPEKLATSSKAIVPEAPDLPPEKVIHPPLLRVPVFQHSAVRQDPEVKYDVRSARGGRGGKVAAMASIWGSGGPTGPTVHKSSGGKQRKNSTADPSTTTQKPLQSGKARQGDFPNRITADPLPITTIPKVLRRTPVKSLLAASNPFVSIGNGEPKLMELAGKHTKPIAKSTSVPAVISSSHAIPMLSSTASLARPVNKTRPAAMKALGTANDAKGKRAQRVEVPVEIKQSGNSGKTLPGDLAFGQARLRDLIKKYQGQGA